MLRSIKVGEHVSKTERSRIERLDPIREDEAIANEPAQVNSTVHYEGSNNSTGGFATQKPK